MDLKVRVYPKDKDILTTGCKLVAEIDFALTELLHRMAESLEGLRAVGLAAPQIGYDKRFFVMWTPEMDEPIMAINPVIVQHESEVILGKEGCLSLPGLELPIMRFRDITLQYTNIGGRPEIIQLEAFEARVAQHEIDHLDGVLIPTRVSSRLGEKLAWEKYDKIRREQARRAAAM